MRGSMYTTCAAKNLKERSTCSDIKIKLITYYQFQLTNNTGPDNTVPTLTILPDDTAATQNLLGFPGATGSTRQEVKQILGSLGITTTAFPETVTNTRFNLQLMLNISAILSEFGMFRSDKLVIPNMTVAGSNAKLIKTDPQGGQKLADTRWVDAVVQPLTVANTSLNSIGATYFASFQLVKRNFGRHPWNIPAGWVDNCNDHRALPQNYEQAQFAALYNSQSFWTIKVIEWMVKKQIDALPDSALQRDVKENHMNERQHCENCGQTLESDNALEQDIKESQMNERQHVCDLCSKEFKRKVHLQRHQNKTH
ncbi:hypothetical protein V9T40_013271 [Parthenolecanium corni]|uniref:C2H2-type domain-containing protein n=1 Tax=Parthenolecanium corni TaxID=536013 RepID=A0AAN9TL11_9HEMI